jgi:hypothetical protein
LRAGLPAVGITAAPLPHEAPRTFPFHSFT